MDDTDAGIVVVGGGVAGLEIVSALGRMRGKAGGRKSIPAITLIDRDSAHIWKPMLHTIAAGTRDVAAQQTTYIAHAFRAGFLYQPGEVCGLDRQRSEIAIAPLHSADGRLLIPARRLRYRALVMALGSQANDFGTPGVMEHCFKIDSRRQADAFNQEIRTRLMQSLMQNSELSIAIVGGGATGVELAAELVQLTASAVAYGATGLAAHVRIALIESGPRLLAAFPEQVSIAAEARLRELGVTVMTAIRVTAAHADGFTLGNGQFFAATLSVWAAGVKAADFLGDFDGLEATRGNQLVVNANLQTTRDPAIYAVGDCASLVPEGADRPLPPTAQVANQQAQYLIRHLPGALAGASLPAFKYRDFGALVSLGGYDAFGSLGKFGFFKGGFIRGRAAQLGHVLLYRSHQARIHGFWHGGLIWLVDLINERLRPTIRLD